MTENESLTYSSRVSSESNQGRKESDEWVEEGNLTLYMYIIVMDL